MNNPQIIPLFTATDSNYLTGAIVTIVSAIVNCGEGASLNIHLMQSGLNAESICQVHKTISPFLKDRHTFQIDEVDDGILSRLPVRNVYLNQLTYARLLIPSMYPDLDWAVYLDSDIIVQKDLSELVKINMGNNLVAAVTDIRKSFGGSKDCDVFKMLKYNYKAPYFAAGFLMLNLKLWRSENVLKHCIEMLEEHGENFKQEDQTVLNLVAYDRWLRLPNSWNFLVILRRDRARFVHSVPVNYHTILQYKPWRFSRVTPCEITSLFYRYLDMTEWYKFRKDEQMFTCICPWFRVIGRKIRVSMIEAVYILAGRLFGTEFLRRA